MDEAAQMWEHLVLVGFFLLKAGYGQGPPTKFCDRHPQKCDGPQKYTAIKTNRQKTKVRKIRLPQAR